MCVCVLGLLIVEVSRFHSYTPHSGIVIDLVQRPYLTTHNIHRRQTFMPTVGFGPTIPAREWLQIYAFCLILMLSVIELWVLVNQGQYAIDCLCEVKVCF